MPWKEVNYIDQRVEFVLKSFDKNIYFKQLCKEYGIASKTAINGKAGLFKMELKDYMIYLEDLIQIQIKLMKILYVKSLD